MKKRQNIVIVGGGHAGGRVAELLVRGSGNFNVTIIGEEPVPPYERPPLSKKVLLGEAGLEECLLWKKKSTADGLVIRLGSTVERVNRQEKTVFLCDGTTLPYDQLVLATGSRVREFSIPGSHFRGAVTLRSFADSQDVSKRFLAAKKMSVVGGGFIGLEVASVAAQRGFSPKVVEASDRLLSRLVPPMIAERIAKTHRDANVDLSYGAMVTRFVSDGHGNVKRAVLSNGDSVDCDLAVIAVGVEPVIDLAEEAGLKIDVGVSTDEQLRTSDPDIFACGDIASFWHPLYAQRIRLESWQNAEDHAKIVASAILGDEVPEPAVPFFWSDQFELSLQILGLPHLGSSVRRKMATDQSAIFLHFDPRERLVGATAFGIAEEIGREMRQTKHLIAALSKYDPESFGADLEIVDQ